MAEIKIVDAPLQGSALLLGGALLALAIFMVVLDTTIANVSVPSVSGALAVSPTQGTWVITSYSVAEAITVPLTGWLAQRFGTVRVFCLAMAGFALFSFLCGVAPSLVVLVALRGTWSAHEVVAVALVSLWSLRMSAHIGRRPTRTS